MLPLPLLLLLLLLLLQDRIGRNMIDDAEAKGLIKPGGVGLRRGASKTHKCVLQQHGWLATRTPTPAAAAVAVHACLWFRRDAAHPL
jgi:hypothetical protein